MEISDDLRSAKRTISSRLLRLGLEGGVVGMLPSVRIHDAVSMGSRNVHGVGVGKKEVNGKPTKTTCIRVHVIQKMPRALLNPSDAIPASIDGLPTDVIESPPAFTHSAQSVLTSQARRKPSRSTSSGKCSTNRKKRQRPIVAGISAAHQNVTAGTIAYFCNSTSEGDDRSDTYLLSNNHVFADVNNANTGDDIYQQSPSDGGTAQNHVADLTRYENIALGGSQGNKVDAAIAKLHSNVTHRPEICKIGKLVGTETAKVGTKVRKHGRTTGYTEGEVSDDAYDALVGMDHNNPNIVGLFEDQLRIVVSPGYSAFGLGGDSGSMVVHRTRRRAVGLYFAGPTSGSYGLANHIDDVLSALQVKLA